MPIIFLTAYYSEDQHVLEGYSTGAVDYLHKPINPAILRSKVAVFAELYRKSRESARANQSLQREVIARRRAEEQLRQLNDELERRVAERTERLLKRERELRSLADNSPDILTRFDREWRYVFVNLAIEKATGRPRETFLGRSMAMPVFPKPSATCGNTPSSGLFSRRENSRRSSSTTKAPADYGISPLAWFLKNGAGGKIDFVLGLTQDVTDRKRAEQALKTADRRKDEFLATLAHELRNPLAPLLSGLQLLNIARDPAVVADTRNMMNRQLSHMVRLVDDLLDASRITNDKLTLRKERVPLRTVVETAVEASRPVIDAPGTRQARLAGRTLWLDADPTRLAQVISNLLTNAAKYTPEGGCIELAAETDGPRSHYPCDGHRAWYSSRDAGRGFRDVHPGESHARALAGRAGHWPGPGQATGRAARRHDCRPEPWARRRKYLLACDFHSSRIRRWEASRERPPRPSRLRPPNRAVACWWSMTMSTVPRAWRRSSKSADTRPGPLMTGRRPWMRLVHSSPTSSARHRSPWHERLRGGEATPRKTRHSPAPCWSSPSRAGGPKTISVCRARPASITT